MERNAFVTKSEEDNNAIPLKVMELSESQKKTKKASCETSIE